MKKKILIHLKMSGASREEIAAKVKQLRKKKSRPKGCVFYVTDERDELVNVGYLRK